MVAVPVAVDPAHLPVRMSAAEFRALLEQGGMAAPAKGTRNQPEFEAQVRFFVLVDLLAELHPARAGELEDVWSTSSGGIRQRGEAGKMREAGQRRGVLDIECMVPAQGCHALFIELKSDRGRLTSEQSDRIERLTGRGYRACVQRGWVAAGKVLCDYLDLPFPRQAETLVELALKQRIADRRKRRKARRKSR